MKKIFSNSLLAAVIAAYSFESKAATVNISAGSTELSSAFTSGDSANFLGSGKINVDAANTLDSITANFTQSGWIDFTTANTLTVSNDMGSSSNTLLEVKFNADGVLQLGGNLYAASGITTNTNDEGSLTLSGSAAQTISGVIGAAKLKLNTVTIDQDVGVTFSNSVYANNLETSANSGTLAIVGNGGLNFSTSNFNVSSTISGSGTISLGDTTLANAKTLTFNTDATIADLASGDSSSVVEIASGKTLSVTGDITGTGVARGVTTGVGNLAFTGSSAQSVSATYQIGESSNRLNTVSISNNAGVTFNNDVYLTNLAFNQLSGTSVLTIASGKVLDISGNITNATSGTTSTISGSGTVELTGTSAQTIAANFGSGTSDRLSELAISNSSGITLNGDAYLTTLTSSSAGTITANGILNVSNSAIDESTTIAGLGTINLGAVTLANSKTLTLNSSATFTNLSSGNSSSVVEIASGKTLSITGDITGTGIARGASSGVGNMVFAGTSAQTVSSTYQIGDSSNRLGTISISNNNGVTFNNDAYITSLTFNQSSGSSTLTIASGQTLDISGDVTGSDGVITGDGSISLSGTSAQTIAASFGSGTGDRLAELEINNSAGVILGNNNYLTDLTLTSGALTIAGDTATDVTNAVDLSSKTINFKVGSSFGEIISGAGITVDGSTNINIDYSTNTANLNYDDSTQYQIAESGSGISGSISGVTVSDNSYLFNNALAINGNNIVTTISSDSTVLSESNLGSANYNLISNALNYTNLSSGLISISSSAQLTDAIQTLKPMDNAAQLTSVISSNSNIVRIVNSHSKDQRAKEQGLSKSVWGQAFGSNVNQQSRENTAGYTENSGGIVFGADKILTPNNAIGVAVGYNKSNISGDTVANNKIGIDSYQLVLYNSNAREDNLGFYNDNALNLNLNHYKTDRMIQVGTFSENAKASFSGKSAAARVGFGYNAKTVDDVFIDPNFAMEYFAVSQDSYQETGAQSAGLKVKTQNVSGYFSDLGVKVSKKFKLDDHNLTPKINLNWRHALGDYQQKSTIAFIGGGSEMTNNSIATQKDIFNLGLGANIDQGGDDSLQVQLDLKMAEKLVGTTLWAKYILLF